MICGSVAIASLLQGELELEAGVAQRAINGTENFSASGRLGERTRSSSEPPLLRFS